MKKLIVLAAVLAANLAHAEGWYAGATYDQKDKVNSAEVHNVYGLNVGNKLGGGWTVEGRMEDEKVDVGDGTQKQEGLAQVKVTKDIDTGTFVTPYAAVAVGQKNKSTVDFPFWIGEAGLKVKINETFGIKYNWRQRTAFDNNTTNSYDTKEQTLALGVNLTKVDNISIAYKQERGTSDYNTKGVYYTRSF
jgi:hypothetical protein